MTDLVHRYGPALDGPPAPAPPVDNDDIRALMAPPRTPNVYAALEDLSDEREAEEQTALQAAEALHQDGELTAVHAPVPASLPETDDVTTAASSRSGREVDWSALGAEAVGPDHLRWRREDDDIIATGAAAGGRRGLRLLRRG